jgi:hypothetical protein
MLLETDHPETTTSDDPQALIEEARQRQRQRARRRDAGLTAVALLVIVGLAVGRLVQGGGATRSSAPSASAAPAQTRTVTFKKIVEEKIVPLLPVETRTSEAWSTPAIGRGFVTLSGGRRIEIGITRVHDKVRGLEQVDYLYDPSTNTIYRTGTDPVPPGESRTPEQVYRQEILGQPGFHLAGTRTYRGRRVYVVKAARPNARFMDYVDTRTYQLLLDVGVSTDLRRVERETAYRALPATKATLALASLWAMHPHARTALHAPPRIEQLYEKATSDL